MPGILGYVNLQTNKGPMRLPYVLANSEWEFNLGDLLDAVTFFTLVDDQTGEISYVEDNEIKIIGKSGLEYPVGLAISGNDYQYTFNLPNGVKMKSAGTCYAQRSSGGNYYVEEIYAHFAVVNSNGDFTGLKALSLWNWRSYYSRTLIRAARAGYWGLEEWRTVTARTVSIDEGRGHYNTVTQEQYDQFIADIFANSSTPKTIADADISLYPTTYIYDGEAKEPTVTVTYNGVQLTEGVDYIKTYENNINPGTASVLIAGQGEYTGSQRVYFTISYGIDTNDIANATITLSPSMYYYDGTAKTPNVTVKMGAVQLTEGTDYIKTYENNINEGLASVLVAGQGDYTGSKRAYFSIYSATNPYGDLEPSGPSDTTPTYDYSSDTIGLPTLPDVSMADVGLVRIYNPTKAQLNSLAQYLWTDTTFIDTLINHFKQIFESPMNAIIALNLLPCPVPNSGAQELKVMYIPTGVQMNVATNQFVDVDCGKVTIETVYGSALDYTPYTRASIFLPYVGQVSLNVDEIMGKVLRVHYRVDIVTGGCVALIDVDGTVMYQFSGHCAISMPLTGADFSNLIGALIQSAKAAATIAGGGVAAIAGAAEGATRFASSRKSTPSASVEMGNKIAAMDSDMMDFGGLAAKNIGNTVGAVMGSKPDISRTGTFSGNTGYLGIRRPYVILERPRLCNPAEYGKFNGYPSMQTVQLNNVRGYTQVQQVQLTGISATGPELDELQTLLKQGVIL